MEGRVHHTLSFASPQIKMTFTKIVVVIYDKEVYRACKFFYNSPILKILYGNALNYKADVFVTSGNSFSIMSGGNIDSGINTFFNQIEKRVQRRILIEWRGELPVGVSMVFHAPGNARYNYLCYTPMMRLPANIESIQATGYNTYIAFRGALIECSKYSDIETIVVPVFHKNKDTVEHILHQIKMAYESFLNPIKPEPASIKQHLSQLHVQEEESDSVEESSS